MIWSLAHGHWLPGLAPLLAGLTCVIFVVATARFIAGKTQPEWLDNLAFVTFFTVLPLSGFVGLAQAKSNGVPNYGLSIGFALGLGRRLDYSVVATGYGTLAESRT